VLSERFTPKKQKSARLFNLVSCNFVSVKKLLELTSLLDTDTPNYLRTQLKAANEYLDKNFNSFF